jgi:hypothetical protein
MLGVDFLLCFQTLISWFVTYFDDWPLTSTFERSIYVMMFIFTLMIKLWYLDIASLFPVVKVFLCIFSLMRG